MKLFIEVQPNSWNDRGYNIVIYKGWKYFRWEIGRVIDRWQLNDFIETYAELNMQEIQLCPSPKTTRSNTCARSASTQ